MTPEQRANTAQVMQQAIWQTADKFLRGVVEEEDYGDYIIPFAVLRRLECLLEDTKSKVLEFVTASTATGHQLDFQIRTKFGLPFFNTSTLDLATISATDDNVAAALEEYVAHFSDSVSDLWEKFDFSRRIQTLDQAGRLWGVCRHFANLDMHPDRLSDMAMGDIFEDVMYRAFNTKGKGAGAFYTPRDAIELMVEVLFSRDDENFQGKGQSRSVYDPTAGTGGMLLVAKRALKELNPDIDVNIFGQEMMDAAFAIGK